MANPHPVIDGKTIEDAFTKAWVEANFVPKDTVRSDYVPKTEHIARLDEKSKAIDKAAAEARAAKDALVEAQGVTTTAQAAAARLAELEAAIAARDDADALRSVGIVTATGEVDNGRADLLRHVFDRHVETLEESVRPKPEAKAEAFRAWVKDPEGAAKHPHLGSWVKVPGAGAAQAAAGTTVTAPKAPASVAQPNPNVNTANPPAGGKMTQAQLAAYLRSPAFLAMPIKDQAAKVAELKSSLMPA